MLQIQAHDDVLELGFTTWRARLAGFLVRAYVVRGTLIDTAFPAVAGDLARYLAEHRPRAAALTHYHEDHAGGAALVAKMGIPMWMPTLTAARIAAPKPLLPYRHFTWGQPEPVRGVARSELPAGLEAIPTPGHSDDHHAFWDPDTRTVFGGDLFIGVKVRVAHATEDARTTVASLRRIIALEPRRYFDAHRGLVPNPVAALTAKADWIEGTIARVEALRADGFDDATIARRVLGSDRLGRWYTSGDYTMENWVRGVRRPLAG